MAKLIVTMPSPVVVLSGATNNPSDWRAPMVIISIAAAAKVMNSHGCSLSFSAIVLSRLKNGSCLHLPYISTTTRPRTVPAFSSSSVPLTSDNSRFWIGIGWSLPSRASATTCFNSSTLPRWEPWTVSAR